MTSKKMKNIQYIVSIICFIIIIIRIIFPEIKFDQISFMLIIIGFVSLLTPDIHKIISRLKKFKKGDIELEFFEKINKLDEQANNIKKHLFESISNDFKEEKNIKNIDQQISTLFSEPGKIIVKIVSEIENDLNVIFINNNIKIPKGIIVFDFLDKLEEINILDNKIITAIKNFWFIRCGIIHGVRKSFKPWDLIIYIENAQLLLKYINALSKGKVKCPKCNKSIKIDEVLDNKITGICEKCGKVSLFKTK